MSFKPFGCLNVFVASNPKAFDAVDADMISAALEKLPFRRASEGSMSYSGWVSPHMDMSVIAHVAKGNMLMCLKTEEKKINTSELKERIQIEETRIKKETGEPRIPKDKRSEIKTKIEAELLKTAQSKFSTIMGWLNFNEKRLIVNVGGMKQAERFIDMLERTITLEVPNFAGFTLTPAVPKDDVCFTMTNWLEDKKTVHDKIELLNDCTIQSPLGADSKKGKIAYSSQALESDENLEKYLSKGYSVVNLHMGFSEQPTEEDSGEFKSATLSLDESFMIKKFKLGACFKDIVKQSDYDSEMGQFDVEFDAFTTCTDDVLNAMIDIFGGLKPIENETNHF
ncbi:recombination-associated protein RdgC [Vibrio splendidus]|nr:recombination-associated protein RdgC [Vibrio splendidus]MCC4880413.1 recombination-associated protein RdgC [Vibrio splendidus]